VDEAITAHSATPEDRTLTLAGGVALENLDKRMPVSLETTPPTGDFAR